MVYPVVLLLLLQLVHSQTALTGEEIISWMHHAYVGKWYSTVTFTQKTVQYLPDGTQSIETWFEAAKLPGMLRIEIAPVDSGNGMLFVNDSIYRIDKGFVRLARPMIHPLMVLGFDVYAQPVAETMRKIDSMRIDVRKTHETIWQGRVVYVVGALSGDTVSNQFWIEKERLLFVRSLMKEKGKSSAMQETQFNKYVLCGKGWIETEVLFFVNGKISAEEHYRDIRAEIPLDDRLFIPSLWNEVRINGN